MWMARNLMTLGCSHGHAKASIDHCFCAFRLSSIFDVFPTNSIVLGCNQIFQFAPCAPHHNHLDCFHPIMGTHFLCLKFITHHGFQFGLEDFERLLPSMVHTSPFSSTKSLRIWSTMNFFPTSSPPLWSSVPCPFMD
jgi:hypothetical protein